EKIYGRNIMYRNKDENQEAKYNTDVKNIKNKIVEIMKERNSALLKYELRMRDIAQVYWLKLIAMVWFLRKHLGHKKQNDIKIALVDLEQKNIDLGCEVIGGDFVDRNTRDNCIISALCNLLMGIREFKYQYGEEIN